MHPSDIMLCVISVAVAGSLGWGIRGVFGGPVGAMIPGALMGGTVAFWLPHLPDKATGFWLMAAIGAAAFNPGGGMTYGQTLGLVHGPDRTKTYWWGVLGCFIKGGLWFGVGAVLLGLAAHGALQNTGLVAGMAAVSIIAGYLGKRLLNYPMNPPTSYPLIYFSRRAKGNIEVDRPRQESWGGMLFGLIALILYGWLVLGENTVWPMAGIGFIAGGIGFALGEIIQAWGIWRKPFGDTLQPWIDWWKVMEMTFGAIGGAGIGLALVLYKPHKTGFIPPVSDMQIIIGIALLVTWLMLVIADKFDIRSAEKICDIPMLCGAMLIVSISAAMTTIAPVIVCGFLLYSSGLNNLRRWQGDISQQSKAFWHILIIIIATSMCFIQTWSPACILILVALIQCVMALIKAIGEQPSGSLGQRLRTLHSAIPVNASFILLTGLLWALIYYAKDI